jgi:putative ABC transport system permease protein
MNLPRKLRGWVRALFRKRELDARMDEEMRSHIEMQTQEKIEAGMNPEEARRTAMLDFGAVESIKERCRDERGVRWIETLGQDIHYGARTLRKNPAFTVMAVLTLALGIGANTAIFSVVYVVLLRPLPYPEPAQLVQLRMDWSGSPSTEIGSAAFLEVRAQSQALARIAAYTGGDLTLTGGGSAERTETGAVTADFFPLLGVQPAIRNRFNCGRLWRLVNPGEPSSGLVKA